MSTDVRRVLVTGSEGYIGSVMCPMLMEAGFHVSGIDAGWFEDGELVSYAPEHEWRRMDIRDMASEQLADVDAIVHLAALSNDPLGELNPDLTYEINLHATVRLAKMAREMGVRRFINSSSCSIYGAAGDKPLTEDASFNPLTAYAKSKVQAEAQLAQLVDDSFSVVNLRNATAYGISPRQRFSLVHPNLAASAWLSGEIRMTSDGSPWRPLVHIRDIALAAIECLRAPREDIHGRSFNIGPRGANYQIREIAQVIAGVFPDCPVTCAEAAGPDQRTYLVDFEAVHEALPGFVPRWDIHKGANECAAVFESISLDQKHFEDSRYWRLKRIRELLNTGQLGPDLRPVGAARP